MRQECDASLFVNIDLSLFGRVPVDLHNGAVVPTMPLNADMVGDS